VISFQASRVQIPLAPMKTGSYCGIGEEVLLKLMVAEYGLKIIQVVKESHLALACQ
jgi:hypothetical protein